MKKFNYKKHFSKYNNYGITKKFAIINKMNYKLLDDSALTITHINDLINTLGYESTLNDYERKMYELRPTYVEWNELEKTEEK